MTSLRRLGITLVTLLAVGRASPAAADDASAPPAVGLDFHAAKGVSGCLSGDRFADEVSAKLGFVPWDAYATTAVRIRIVKDGDEAVGTLEQPDGSSKVLRAATCAALGDALVSAVTVALDRPAVVSGVAAGTTTGGLGLRTLTRDTPVDDNVRVRLRVPSGRKLRLMHVIDSTVAYGGGWMMAASTTSSLCTAPCETTLPRGDLQLVVVDEATKTYERAGTSLTVNSTLDVDYLSRADVRRGNRSKLRWGALLGAVGGAIGTAAIIQTTDGFSDARWVGHLALDPAGMLVGAIIGAGLSYIFQDGHDQDEAHVTVRPGLVDAATARY